MTTTTRRETCPSIEELRAQLEGVDAEVSRHLEICRRCQALLRLLAEGGAPLKVQAAAQAEGTAEEVAHPPSAMREDSGEIAEGAVIVTSTALASGELLLAVVLDTTSEAAGTDGLIVAPLSTEIQFASEADVVLDPASSPLLYRAMAEVWNEGRVLREQVEEVRGKVDARAFERVAAIRERALLDDEDLAGAATDHETVGDGPPILDDADPRLLFQDEEIERAEAFYLPAAERLFAEREAESVAGARSDSTLTVGALLSQWLDEQGYGTDDYAREIGAEPRHVELARIDKIDPAFGPDRIVTILRRPVRDRDIDLDDLHAALTRSFAEDADWTLVGGTTQGRVFARTSGRRGRARSEALRRQLGGEGPLSAEEVERRKRSFINDVLAGLEEKPER